MVTKFNVSMSPELYVKFEAACKEMGVTRSAFISFAVSQMISSQKVAGQLPELLEAVKQLQTFAAQNMDAVGLGGAADSARLGDSIADDNAES